MSNQEKIDLLNTLPCIYHEKGNPPYHYIEVNEQARAVLNTVGQHDGWIEFHSVPGENGPEMCLSSLAFKLGATGHDGTKFLYERNEANE
ncbi:hypothetical protein M3223_04170 [Paenibacillus pasadenensis]|uniref:hypothetical protein n=1 Tax=Paenibacillus pasadenensis TaxID=217090 RepID=UPI00203B683D|nr:hypothetical protein [Paenibacillus pasadenensis]MCM3746545.1 hypothetical protein [Paenibacillus pasadenensis]